MKKLLFMGIFAFAISLSVSAQGSLSGRVYHCANMMKGEMEKIKSDFNKDVQKEKDVTAEEKKEANQIVQAMMDAIITTMTVKFLSDKELELSMLVKYDDAKAKANDVPWIARKLVAGKLKGKSYTKKAPYTFDGKTVKLSNPKTKQEMLLRLSSDGKTMYFTTEKNKTIQLTRTK
ncbi:MAG: hypothetical protein IKX69_05460 [Prevotella sp.]|nr:hypothetical protein [Prevotella sp.]